MKKIYCTDCIHLWKIFRTGSDYFSNRQVICRKDAIKESVACHYIDNIGIVDDWYSNEKYNIKHPSEINKNNDCKWFYSSEERDSKMINCEYKDEKKEDPYR